MSVTLRPHVRAVDILPVEQDRDLIFLLRDPEGLSQPMAAPYAAAVLVTLMDGERTLAQIQDEFRAQLGSSVPLAELERLVRELDEAFLLEGNRFEAFRKKQVERYLAAPARRAVHAGSAYPDDPDDLRDALAGFFTSSKGPGQPKTAASGGQLRAVISPHIDLHRGGPAYAWAYRQIIEQSDADVFVLFGTAHHAMDQLFSVTRKDFETPLGTVRTDIEFISRLAGHLALQNNGHELELFADEFAHKQEHSIEFQVVFLQYLLGAKRPFRIVPVLAGSLHEFLVNGGRPDGCPEFRAFVTAMKATIAESSDRVFFISGADLAHIGTQFGDPWDVDDQRLTELSTDDRQLLEAACHGDAAAVFDHVAAGKDRSRICGLAPIYTMLEVAGPLRGELLAYDQAVDDERSSCVSFASVAYYPRARFQELVTHGSVEDGY